MPLPRDETTPPVTKMCFVMWGPSRSEPVRTTVRIFYGSSSYHRAGVTGVA